MPEDAGNSLAILANIDLKRISLKSGDGRDFGLLPYAGVKEAVRKRNFCFIIRNSHVYYPRLDWYNGNTERVMSADQGPHEFRLWIDTSQIIFTCIARKRPEHGGQVLAAIED